MRTFIFILSIFVTLTHHQANAIETITIPFGSYTTPDAPSRPIQVNKFIIRNPLNNFTAEIIEFGATLTNLWVPNSLGELKDIVLGFDDLIGYLAILYENPYFGSTIGRTSNRIKDASFFLNGVKYQLGKNDGEHNLHGGPIGFNAKKFEGHIQNDQSVVFSVLSEDGDQGFPNAVMAQVRYSITLDNELVIEYRAMCDGTTPLSMTHHTYFNLDGHESTGSQLKNHSIQINADHYTPTGPGNIPTGEIASVNGTKFDLRTTRDLNQLLIQNPSGYDDNFCLNGDNIAAVLSTPTLNMTIKTTFPGLQLYTGNFLPVGNSCRGKGGVFYHKQGALCLEAQAYPDAINHQNFPSVILGPWDVYEHKVVYDFDF